MFSALVERVSPPPAGYACPRFLEELPHENSCTRYDDGSQEAGTVDHAACSASGRLAVGTLGACEPARRVTFCCRELANGPAEPFLRNRQDFSKTRLMTGTSQLSSRSCSLPSLCLPLPLSNTASASLINVTTRSPTSWSCLVSVVQTTLRRLAILSFIRAQRSTGSRTSRHCLLDTTGWRTLVDDACARADFRLEPRAMERETAKYCHVGNGETGDGDVEGSAPRASISRRPLVAKSSRPNYDRSARTPRNLRSVEPSMSQWLLLKEGRGRRAPLRHSSIIQLRPAGPSGTGNVFFLY